MIRSHTTDENMIVFKSNKSGLLNFQIKAKDLSIQEYVRKAWLKDITNMQESGL